MNRKLAFSLLLGAFAVSSWAQQAVTVKGTVKDAENNPVIGATVVVKGTTIGTTTDIDGNYTINVNPGQVLEFSYVGMQQSSITVGNKNVINITMADGEQLDEVVVIGYGTVKKSHLTGAVSSVSGKDLQANIARDASSAMQGRIAGVTVTNASGQPGEGMNISIRGTGSLKEAKPLYVIDGVYGDINMVDPADIQSIEVLKDASAAAIYGSRAANGVVLITTKGGRKETPTRVSVDAYTGIQTVAKYMDAMDGNEFRDFCKQSGMSNAEELLNWQGKGTDWQKELFQTAVVSKVGMNVTGGNKTSSYNVSGSYLNQNGIVKTTGYEAWNIRAKNDFSLFNNHVRVGSTVMLKMWKQDWEDVSYTSALTAVPQWNVRDENGEWGKSPSWIKGGDNPVGWTETHDYQKNGIDILLNAFAEVDLGLKGLKYKFNVGIDKKTRRNYNYTYPYNFGSQSSNNVTQLREGTDWQNLWMIENTLHYDNTFGKHNLSALLGYSAQRDNSRSFSAGRNSLPNLIYVIDAGDPATATTGGSAWANTLVSMFARFMYSYDDRYMLSASIRRDGSSKFADGHRYGNFPSVSAGWNMMNEEFFSNLKNTVNELKIRASYGVLGNLNGIGNYDTQSIVQYGNNAVQGNSWWLGGITGHNWTSPANVTWEETKTWDIGIDAGLFNNKLTFSADYFVQNTNGMLISVNQPSSFGLSGSPVMNAALVENKGLELSINHRNTVGEFFYNVGFNATFLKNNLKEIQTPSRQEFTGFDPHAGGPVTYATEGKPIGYFNVIKSLGIFQSVDEIKAYVNDKGEMIQPKAKPGDLKFEDYNGDGIISEADKQDCGSPYPKMTMGLTLGAQWKDFDLNLFFDGSFGNKIFSGMRYSIVKNEGVGNQLGEMRNAWNENNKNTDVPRYYDGTGDDMTTKAYTDRWLENGSFFRLKTLEVGYTLPKTLTNKLTLQNVRVYSAMSNLFTATSYSGYTPDLGMLDGSVMTRGCDDGRFPVARTFTFGLQVNF